MLKLALPMPHVDASELERFSAALLAAGGVPADEAQLVAESLVGANLRGHDSHGVMRVPYYLEFVREGRLVPGAPLRVVGETPAALACDAGWGFGQVQCRRLIERLLPKARALGIACGTLSRSGHVGRVGEYAEQAAAAGLATLALVNTHGAGPRVAPPGGKEARIGTNPLCVGIPTTGEPIVLDFGTSAVAEGKVRILRIAGKRCPEGWLIDSDGKPTTDPNVLYREPPGSILPMGAAQSYKGFGLGLVIDMLAGGLSGGMCAHPGAEPPLGNDALFVLLDPARLGGTEHFLKEVSGVSAYARSSPTVEGVAGILLPGDPERRTRVERERRGIPLDPGNWERLTDLAGRLGVPVPATRAEAPGS